MWRGRVRNIFLKVRTATSPGKDPATSDDAIAQLESLRGAGAEYLVLPAPAFWWLDHYARFREHLEQRYPVIFEEYDACIIFRLTPRTGPLYHTFSVVICT